MLFTLTLVILIAAIVILFSQEFIRIFKKIFAIRGAKLMIPLMTASWLVYSFEIWGTWLIYYYATLLKTIVLGFAYFIPFEPGASTIAFIIVLTLISVLPVLLYDRYVYKKTYKHFKYPYLTSTLIWIFNAVVSLVANV